MLFTEAYFEVELVNRLQSVIEKQRGQIKKLDQSVLNYKIKNDEVRITQPTKSPFASHIPYCFQLSKQNEKLSACTKDLRRKCRMVQNQLHEMVDERAELTAKVISFCHNTAMLSLLKILVNL